MKNEGCHLAQWSQAQLAENSCKVNANSLTVTLRRGSTPKRTGPPVWAEPQSRRYLHFAVNVLTAQRLGCCCWERAAPRKPSTPWRLRLSQLDSRLPVLALLMTLLHHVRSTPMGKSSLTDHLKLDSLSVLRFELSSTPM